MIGNINISEFLNCSHPVNSIAPRTTVLWTSFSSRICGITRKQKSCPKTGYRLKNNSEVALMWNQIVSNSASNCIEIAIDKWGDLVKPFPNNFFVNSPVSTLGSYIITHNVLISDQLSAFTIWSSVFSIEILDAVIIPR
jgi:hypothetical protein